MIETLVALTIFSLVGLAVFSLLNRAVAARKVIRENNSFLNQVQQVSSLVTADLVRAQNFALSPFWGTADSLGFTARVETLDHEPALRRLLYYSRPAPGRQRLQLMRSVSDFRDGTRTATLLTGIRSLRFRYLRKEAKGSRWLENWPASASMPLAVHVEVILDAGHEPINLICPIRTQSNVTTESRKTNYPAAK